MNYARTKIALFLFWLADKITPARGGGHGEEKVKPSYGGGRGEER